MSAPRLLHLAALVQVVAAAAVLIVLFFGGATVHTCFGGPGPMCPTPVVPPIRTSEGIAISLAICGLAWLAANAVILVHMLHADRRRLVRLAREVVNTRVES